MYCDNCGAELSNGARVCDACGAAVKAGGSIDNTDDLIAAHAAATRGAAARAKADDASLPPNDPYIAFYASQRARERRHFVALVIGVCVLLMSAVAFALPAITGTSGVRPGRIAGERRMDDGLEKVGVALPVQAARLDENGSRIPIRVSGHLPQGASYNDAVYVTHEGVSVDLPVGTFEVWVSQTPIASDGTMYRLPESRLQVEVSENFDVTFPGENATLELKELSGSEISDELIESARSWISKDPEKSGRADELAQKAKERRDAQVAKERENAPTVVVPTTTQQEQQKTDNTQKQDDNSNNDQQGDNDKPSDGDNDKPSDGGDNDKPSSDGDNDKPSDGGDNDKPSDGDNDKPSSDGDTPADPTPTVDPTPSDDGGSSGGDTPVTPSEPVTPTPAEPTTPTTPDASTSTTEQVQTESVDTSSQTQVSVTSESSKTVVEA